MIISQGREGVLKIFDIERLSNKDTTAKEIHIGGEHTFCRFSRLGSTIATPCEDSSKVDQFIQQM